MFDDSGQFVRFVSNAQVVSESDPALARRFTKPDDVGTGRRKMIDVAFDVNTGVTKNGGELQAEIAVSEENNTQAARS